METLFSSTTPHLVFSDFVATTAYSVKELVLTFNFYVAEAEERRLR